MFKTDGTGPDCTQTLCPGSFKLQCHLIADPEAGKVLTSLKMLTRLVRRTQRYYQKHLNLQRIIRFYVDICPSHLQDMSYQSLSKLYALRGKWFLLYIQKNMSLLPQ